MNTMHPLVLEGPHKQSEDQVLFARAVKTTIQSTYDIGLLVKYDNPHEVLKIYLKIEVKERRRPSLDQGGCSMSTFQVK